MTRKPKGEYLQLKQVIVCTCALPLVESLVTWHCRVVSAGMWSYIWVYSEECYPDRYTWDHMITLQACGGYMRRAAVTWSCSFVVQQFTFRITFHNLILSVILPCFRFAYSLKSLLFWVPVIALIDFSSNFSQDANVLNRFWNLSFVNKLSELILGGIWPETIWRCCAASQNRDSSLTRQLSYC